MLAGFQGTLQYSMKTEESEEGDENTSDVDKFYAGGLRYKERQLKPCCRIMRKQPGVKRYPLPPKGRQARKSPQSAEVIVSNR